MCKFTRFWHLGADGGLDDENDGDWERVKKDFIIQSSYP